MDEIERSLVGALGLDAGATLLLRYELARLEEGGLLEVQGPPAVLIEVARSFR